MSNEMIESESSSFLNQLNASSNMLLDLYTQNVLKELVLSAIRTSHTFQRLMLFSMQNNKEQLSTIRYRNYYESRDGEPFSTLVSSDILDSSPETINIIIEAEQGEDSQGPYVNISVAPNSGSEQFPHYQAGVLDSSNKCNTRVSKDFKGSESS